MLLHLLLRTWESEVSWLDVQHLNPRKSAAWIWLECAWTFPFGNDFFMFVMRGTSNYHSMCLLAGDDFISLSPCEATSSRGDADCYFSNLDHPGKEGWDFLIDYLSQLGNSFVHFWPSCQTKLHCKEQLNLAQSLSSKWRSQNLNWTSERVWNYSNFK